MRKIIHVDMDCFYAAIECRERPELANLPVGVGGASGRGVLTTCNYVARRYGCRSAMPVFQARQMCPSLVLLPVRMGLYQREGAAIRQIFAEFTDLVEPLSLDEAYLDVSGQSRTAWSIATEIRQRIRDERRLTASAGVAPNKMLAKVASDWRKPNGQFAITPEQVAGFMRDLPVGRLPGVGPKGAGRLEDVGVRTCGKLADLPRWRAHELFGPTWGEALQALARGEDDRPVEVGGERKSMSTERTFFEPLETWEACARALEALLAELAEDLARKPRPPIRRLFVKVKFSDFTRTVREAPAQSLHADTARELLREAFNRRSQPARLVGVGVRFATVTEADTRQATLTFG